MSDFSAAQRARLLDLALRQASAQAGLVDRLVAFVGRVLRGQPPSAFYVTTPWLGEVIGQDVVARQAAAQVMAAYLDEAVTVMGGDPPVNVVWPEFEDVRGVPDEDVYDRPAKVYRWRKSLGDSHGDALDAAVARAEQVAGDDVSLAARKTAAQRLAAVEDVVGYRRVVHPELARRGSCGRCVAAADHFYTKGTLLPIHGGCHCTVLPIVDGRPDPKTLNPVIDVEHGYQVVTELAGATSGALLQQVSVRVVDHSELGPTLEYAHGSRRVIVTPVDAAAAKAS